MGNRDALLLKRTDYREADLIVTLFTPVHGKIHALARGARNSRKRFGGALEPIHTLDVDLDPPKRGDMFDLKSSSVATPRVHLIQDLERLQGAGKVLGWLREAVPERHPEKELWDLSVALLDELDKPQLADVDAALGVFGLQFLALLGWGLDFESCVKCGKECPAGKPGTISASRGGLVCSSCGGGRTRLEAAQRLRLANAAQGTGGLLGSDVPLTLRLVDEALAAHANLK